MKKRVKDGCFENSKMDRAKKRKTVGMRSVNES